MKNVLLSLALIILVVLLFLPFGLRLFGKDLYKDKPAPIQEDTYEFLNCTKINETISTSFKNGKAFNIKYDISGNHVPEKKEETDTKDDAKKEENTTDNKEGATVFNELLAFAQIEYREDENLTRLRVQVDDVNTDNEDFYKHTGTIDAVKSYYEELSFSCTKQ